MTDDLLHSNSAHPPPSYYLCTPEHIAVEADPVLGEVEASLKEDVSLEGTCVV